MKNNHIIKTKNISVSNNKIEEKGGKVDLCLKIIKNIKELFSPFLNDVQFDTIIELIMDENSDPKTFRDNVYEIYGLLLLNVKKKTIQNL